MTNWEYSELSWVYNGISHFIASFTGPGGGERRDVNGVDWLNELAQHGWEVVGYTMGDGMYPEKSCLLRRAV